MPMRDLMPWSRGAGMPARSGNELSPFFAFQREVNRLFDDFFRGFDGGMPMMQAGWPHLEVSETDKELKVCAELPGLEEKDIELTFHDGVLTLKGEKKSETQNPTYSERWHGQFQRSVQLGPEADPEKVSASFKNGVLTVTVGKRPEAQSQVKRIKINS